MKHPLGSITRGEVDERNSQVHKALSAMAGELLALKQDIGDAERRVVDARMAVARCVGAQLAEQALRIQELEARTLPARWSRLRSRIREFVATANECFLDAIAAVGERLDG